ncbi:hypothetical protein [Aquimarina agarilytica]|uniref:hypothetical protein n=1 Tax=Aquimarina agarilytica TaxID=1087449 RepID=UPI00028A2351|nr:hypothetical protein [Aquimarina agarilytica]
MKKIILVTLAFVTSLTSFSQLANTDPLLVNASILRRTLKKDTLEKKIPKKETSAKEEIKRSTSNKTAVTPKLNEAPKEKPALIEAKKEKAVVAVEKKGLQLLAIENRLDKDFFSVQLAASKVNIKEGFFQNSPVFYTKMEDGFYRYFSGKFSTLSEAKAYARKIHATTKFDKAFLVRLKNGVKIPLK